MQQLEQRDYGNRQPAHQLPLASPSVLPSPLRTGPCSSQKGTRGICKNARRGCSQRSARLGIVTFIFAFASIPLHLSLKS